MKRSKRYMQSRDIDWFFRSNDGILIHCASNGGLLPDMVADADYLYNSSKIVATLEDVLTDDEEMFINDDYVNGIVNEQLELMEVRQERTGFDESWRDRENIRKNYLDTFVKMARKGIWSYDRLAGEDNRYVLVARPMDITLNRSVDGFVRIGVLVKNDNDTEVVIPQEFFKD